jgi:hypothetical protein
MSTSLEIATATRDDGTRAVGDNPIDGARHAADGLASIRREIWQNALEEQAKKNASCGHGTHRPEQSKTLRADGRDC